MTATIEASLLNVTLFDRVLPELRVTEVAPVALADPMVREAADLLGLA